VGEFEDKLNELLNNPSQMEKIAGIAKSLMGGGQDEPSAEPELDSGMLKALGGIMQGGNGAGSNDKRLLEAMRPYLSEKRRSKMDKAMKLARLASIASIAAEQFGGEDDV